MRNKSLVLALLAVLLLAACGSPEAEPAAVSQDSAVEVVVYRSPT